MLTDREKDVMRLVARGLTNKEICEKLCIANSTLKTHLNEIYKKFGTNRKDKMYAITRVRAVLIYLGLAKAEDFINE